MSDENETPIEGEEENFFETISDMLDAIVPPKEIIINDINGKEYRLPGAIQARRQIRVFREFQSIWKSEEIKAVASEFEEISVPYLTNLILSMAFNEEVLETLGRAFKEAHPTLVDGDPLDLFAVEEVVTAIVPLLIRFVKRVGKTLLGIGGITQKK